MRDREGSKCPKAPRTNWMPDARRWGPVPLIGGETVDVPRLGCGRLHKMDSFTSFLPGSPVR